jgi:hypothetical protein
VTDLCSFADECRVSSSDVETDGLWGMLLWEGFTDFSPVAVQQMHDCLAAIGTYGKSACFSLLADDEVCACPTAPQRRRSPSSPTTARAPGRLRDSAGRRAPSRPRIWPPFAQLPESLSLLRPFAQLPESL